MALPAEELLTVPARPTVDDVLLAIAYQWARRGTCARRQVGAVLALDGRTLASGYNGVAAGLPHCQHATWRPYRSPSLGWASTPQWAKVQAPANVTYTLAYPGLDDVWYYDNGTITMTTLDEPRPTCNRAVHAEANAIAFAAKYGVALSGATLYTTLAPCLTCAQLVINAGVRRVVYGEPYRHEDGLALLSDANLLVDHLPPATLNEEA